MFHLPAKAKEIVTSTEHYTRVSPLDNTICLLRITLTATYKSLEPIMKNSCFPPVAAADIVRLLVARYIDDYAEQASHGRQRFLKEVGCWPLHRKLT